MYLFNICIYKLSRLPVKNNWFSGFDGVHRIVLQTSCSNESRGGGGGPNKSLKRWIEKG